MDDNTAGTAFEHSVQRQILFEIKIRFFGLNINYKMQNLKINT
jgi:hypothetical protein